MENLTLSVSEFIDFTNQTLDGAYPTVTIEGEVDSFKVNQGKYVFFDIKDQESSVGCFMSLYGLRMPLENGMKIVVQAKPKLTRWGKFSLTVLNMRPVGEGTIKKSFELLKKKLAAEGLFEPARKRPLPSVIRRIALISSTDAAGYADFIKILDERWGGFEVEVAHTQVQGIAAPDQIIRAIQYFGEQPELADVLVIVRGGGSAQDLSAFNDEPLVRAVAASRIPVLTGIGHEVDESLVDLAADAVASTPSNAAERISPDKKLVMGQFEDAAHHIRDLIISEIDRSSLSNLDSLGYLGQAIQQKIDAAAMNVAGLRSVIEKLNPEDVLRRGYAMVRGDLAVGGTIEVTTMDKIIKAEVKNARKR
jgi:exodeoxyribonuclease VII large subunit